MNRIILSFLLNFLGLTLLQAAETASTTTVRVTPQVIQFADNTPFIAKHFGLNLGSSQLYAGIQLLKNLIPNGGFEAGEIAVIFHVAPNATAERVQVDNWDTRWNNDKQVIGQPEQFWKDARYEILTGAAKGQQGIIRDFRHEQDKYTFYLTPTSPAQSVAPQPEDILAVYQTVAGIHGIKGNAVEVDPNENPPDSLGKQSLKLLAHTDSHPNYSVFLDSLGSREDKSAGKLLLIQGRWKLQFWVKSNLPQAKIAVQFRRLQENLFFKEQITLQSGWQKIEREINIPPEWENITRTIGNTLEFHINNLSSEAVWLDELSLSRAEQDNPTVFEQRVVDLLANFNLGVLRNWGGQLGNSLDNQLAPEFARRTFGYQVSDRDPSGSHFSLPEFLQLIHYLNQHYQTAIEPWYVVPPTFSESEWQNLIAYLSAPADQHPYAQLRARLGQKEPWTTVFNKIHLELGNELWGTALSGDPFRGASVRGGVRLGQLAQTRFEQARKSAYFQNEKLDLIIGGQFRYAGRQLEIEQNSTQHDTVAIAPYFGKLDVYDTAEHIYYPLFARPSQDVLAGGLVQDSLQNLRKATSPRTLPATQLAIYEINFHTTATNNDVPLDLRNDFLTGVNGGLAIPLYLLTYQAKMGINTQAVFQLAQYSYKMKSKEAARLWGVMRDLHATQRIRPTGLGLILANRAVLPTLLATEQTGDNPHWQQNAINDIKQSIDVPYIQSFAFTDEHHYRVVLFNLDLTNPQTVHLTLPSAVKSTGQLQRLAGVNINDDNEDEQKVNIENEEIQLQNQATTLILAPHSMSVVFVDK